MNSFCYMIRSRGYFPENYKYLKTQNSQVYISTWLEDHMYQDWFTLMYHPNTTWGEGRNKLLSYTKNKNYDYYIFLDDDLRFDVKKQIPILEKDLTENNIKIAYPRRQDRYGNNEKFSKQHNCDASFSIFHKSIVRKLLPYYNAYQNDSWHYSQAILNMIQNIVYQDITVQYNDILFKNGTEKSYVQRGCNPEYIASILKKDILHPRFSNYTISQMYSRPKDIRWKSKPNTEISLTDYLRLDSEYIKEKERFWNDG